MLFTPGDDPEKLRHVGRLAADVAVADWEDAVSWSRKDLARSVTSDFVESLGEETRPPVFVRVNGLASGRLIPDVASAVGLGASGLIVPKLEDSKTITTVTGAIEAVKWLKRSEQIPVAIWGIIETARGIANCRDIVRSVGSELSGLILGTVDLAADLGIRRSPEGKEREVAAFELVVACRSVGLGPPLDGPWMAVMSTEGLAESCKASRALGFGGRVVIIPTQIEIVNQEYGRETPEETAKARAIVVAFEEAERRGLASIVVEGGFVDYPVYREALSKLSAIGDESS
jgi:citrate lyase subunit beta/citryl-CoA lyase